MKNKDIIDKLLLEAKKQGAQGCEILIEHIKEHTASLRLGEIESLERNEKKHLALRVWVGKRKALIASELMEESQLADLSQRAVQMARATPEDEASRLANKNELAQDIISLDIHDPSPCDEQELIKRALSLESAARAVQGITNSEGASARIQRSHTILATSEGFYGEFEKSEHGIALSVIAGEGTQMERDYEFKQVTHAHLLGDLEQLGIQTALRTLKRLGAQKIKSAALPVVYAPRVAGSLLRHLVEALKGDNLARATSFLRNDFGKKIMAEDITICDEPHKHQAVRSRPFDYEGLQGQKTDIVTAGILTGCFLDLRSAHLLGKKSTAHAMRTIAEHPHPSPSNLYVAQGSKTERELLKDIKRGFYVNELLGLSFNVENGNYSRGASGFLIENGELSHAVNEVTIAGNLKEMFLHLEAGDKIEWHDGLGAPALRCNAMTLAGA